MAIYGRKIDLPRKGKPLLVYNFVTQNFGLAEIAPKYSANKYSLTFFIATGALRDSANMIQTPFSFFFSVIKCLLSHIPATV